MDLLEYMRPGFFTMIRLSEISLSFPVHPGEFGSTFRVLRWDWQMSISMMKCILAAQRLSTLLVSLFSVADQQLCERMKSDARAEVPGQRVLASMTIRQRISCITYLA